MFLSGVQSKGSITLKPSELEVTLRVEGKFCVRLAFKSSSYCACVFSICLENVSVMDLVCWATSAMDLDCRATASAMDCVSSAFCCVSATATAAAMVLASAASLDSWSRLWSLFSAAEEVVPFSSLDRSLPITRSDSVLRTKVGQYSDVIQRRWRWVGKNSVLFSYLCFSEALVVLVVADFECFQVPIRVHNFEYNLSLHLQYAVVISDGLGRSLNTQKVLSKSLLKCCVFLLECTVVIVV